MMKRTKLAVAVGAVCMVPMTQAIAGIDVNAGDWKIDFSGNVNAFYVQTQCDHSTTDPGSTTSVTGGLACTGDKSAAVRNGLLPAALVFSATTRQADLDIDVTIGFYPGINSSAAAGVNGAGQPSALSTPGIDARQAYFTFGDVSWGTVKLGRDIGLFGKDAILDDMTLLGVGTSSSTAAPGNTSLGRIGIGYIYTDWQPQITYTTPVYSGFSGSVGIFQPLSEGVYTSHNSPQVASRCQLRLRRSEGRWLERQGVHRWHRSEAAPGHEQPSPGHQHDVQRLRRRRRRKARLRPVRRRGLSVRWQRHRHHRFLHSRDVG